MSDELRALVDKWEAEAVERGFGGVVFQVCATELRNTLAGGDTSNPPTISGGSSVLGDTDSDRATDRAGPRRQDSPDRGFKMPDRIGIDAHGYGWRAWDDEDYYSMVPQNPDNSPIPEPITWFVRAADGSVPEPTTAHRCVQTDSDFLRGGYAGICSCGWESQWCLTSAEAVAAVEMHAASGPVTTEGE